MTTNDRPNALRVLTVEDSHDDALLFVLTLTGAGYDVTFERVDTPEAMRASLQAQTWDIILSDHSMPAFNSLLALQLRQEFDSTLPFIIVSGTIGEETAVQAIQAGADDFVLKDNLGRLPPAVARAIRQGLLRREAKRSETALRVSEARYRLLASNVPGAIFVLDWGNGDAPRFAYLSESSRNLLGLDPANPGDAWPLLRDRIHPDDAAGFERSATQAAGDNSLWSWEGRLANDQPQWIAINAAPRALGDAGVIFEGVATNVTRTRVAELELLESRSELRRLASHMEGLKERERTQIAREIHDELGGQLSAIKMDLSWLRDRLNKAGPEVKDRLGGAIATSNDALTTARRISGSLRPPILDWGLWAAIEWLGKEMSQRLGATLELALCDERDIDSDLAFALYRILQEALTNIGRHAHATRIVITLDATDSELTLEIADDGVGFDSRKLSGIRSFGLQNMRERAAHLGGEIRLESTPGTGTTVHLTLPLPAAAPAASAPAASAPVPRHNKPH